MTALPLLPVDVDALQAAEYAALEADAGAPRIEVRRMWFAQNSGFALRALPLGICLPKMGW